MIAGLGVSKKWACGIIEANALYHSLFGLATGARLGPLVQNARFPEAWTNLLVGRAVITSDVVTL